MSFTQIISETRPGRLLKCPALPLLLKSHRLVDHAPDGIRRLPFHPLGGMGVGIQCESRAVVAQRIGERLHIYTVLQGERGERMPLWHNKDKSDKPLRRNGLNGLSLFFFQ